MASLGPTIAPAISRPPRPGKVCCLRPPTHFKNAVIRLWDPNIQPAISQQWNLAVEHQFTDSTTFQVAYVGQHGTHLMVAMPYVRQQLHADGTITPSPFLSGNPTLQSKLSQISGTASIGNMRYDSLQATLQKRFSNGLQGQIAYTYSKCMTDSSGYFGSWGQAAPASAYWQNLYDQRAEWGPCYYDVTHVLSGYAVYEVPIGRNRSWGKNLHPLVNAVIADWQVGAIVQLRGGFPLTIVADDASGTNSRGSRGQLRCSSSRVWAKTGSRSHRASSGSTLLPMGRPFRARLELAAWAQSGALAWPRVI